jgi:hypothetical protein
MRVERVAKRARMSSSERRASDTPFEVEARMMYL